MVLEGCAQPQLGCCIILRGGSTPELVRVKKIVKFMLLACYNWKLEKAFLTDIEAVLPEPGMNFEEENEEKKSERFESNDKNENVKDIRGVFDSTCADNNDIFDFNSKEIESNNQKTETENKKSAINTKEESLTSDKNYNETILQSEAKNLETQVSSSNDLENSKDIVFNEKENVDDPLQRPKSYTRKTENLSCGVPIKDFSDPLRSTLSVDDDVFLPKQEAMLQADAQNDRFVFYLLNKIC